MHVDKKRSLRLGHYYLIKYENQTSTDDSQLLYVLGSL